MFEKKFLVKTKIFLFIWENFSILVSKKVYNKTL